MELSGADSNATVRQVHVLGDAVIPQRLRSLRKVRARPPSPDASSRPGKRARAAAQPLDTNEEAIAEMLLGLCNSPRSSTPRESDQSTEDEEFVQASPQKRRSSSKTASPSKSNPRPPVSIELLRSEDLDEECCEGSPASSKSVKSSKKLPGRCKCGKRVSATHPPCKSELMLLCERFCQRCGHLDETGEPSRIHLNECAVALGVPRRRLYDITIVYEAVEVVKRTGKLAYVWRGMAHMPALIEQLKREEEAGLPVMDRKGNSLLPHHTDRHTTTHSLWTLSRKFIRLMLTTKGPIQLTDAADHLIGDQLSSKRQQTQVTVERRLYDIGSILATLNLIHRTYVEGKRQPAFSWNWNWQQDRALLPSTAPAASQGLQALPETRSAAEDARRIGTPLFTAPRASSYELSPPAFTDLRFGMPPAWSMPPNLQLAAAFGLGPQNSAELRVQQNLPSSSEIPGTLPPVFSGASAELPPFAPLVLPPEVSAQQSLHLSGQLQCGHQFSIVPSGLFCSHAQPQA